VINHGSPVRLVVVPYDSGVFDSRMGAGPLALATEAGQRLRKAGHEVREHQVEPGSAWRAEAQTAFELHRAIAEVVRDSSRTGEVPLMLSGNCNATLGVLAGLASPGRRVGLVWLDAHADFNTPDTTKTGFLDGQGLAMVVGRCWATATSAVPGFTPLPEQHVLLIGARDLGEAEEEGLRCSDVTWLPPARVRDGEALDAALEALAGRVDAVHVHVDLDVHDPHDVAPANSYAAPGGLLAAEVQQVVRQTADRLPITSATLASYDPSCDPAARMRQTALDLLENLAHQAGRPMLDHA
jgi:arginase